MTTSRPAPAHPTPASKTAAAKRATQVAPRAAPAPSGPLSAPARQPVHAPSMREEDSPKKPKKVKLVRDSFTMPKDEFAAIALLKQRASRLGRPARKSELLRAGLQALAALSDAELLACVARLPATRASRPAKP